MSTKSCISHNTKGSQDEGEKKFQLKYLFKAMYCQRCTTLHGLIVLTASLCDIEINFIKLTLSDQGRGLSCDLYTF